MSRVPRPQHTVQLLAMPRQQVALFSTKGIGELIKSWQRPIQRDLIKRQSPRKRSRGPKLSRFAVRVVLHQTLLEVHSPRRETLLLLISPRTHPSVALTSVHSSEQRNLDPGILKRTAQPCLETKQFGSRRTAAVRRGEKMLRCLKIPRAASCSSFQSAG